MKYCENCGAELEDSAVFCEECGAKVETVPQEKARKQKNRIMLK